jgi:hypothetical protein
MTFGDVPTSVIRPPRSEPKDSGMRSCEGEVPERFANCSATGISIASAPTFLMNVESTMTANTSTKTCERVVLRYGASGRITISVMPDLATAALTTSAEATMITTSSLKPEKASLGGTIPQKTEATSASIATTS